METSPEDLAPEEDVVLEPETTGCRACGSDDVEPGYLMELCADCRVELSRRPFPGWIRAVAGVVLVATLIAIALSPKSLTADIAFERGRRAEKQGQFATAASEYEKVVERFPRSALAVGRLGIAYLRSDQLAQAQAQFQKLKGRKLDWELANEVNAAIQQIAARAKLAEGALQR